MIVRKVICGVIAAVGIVALACSTDGPTGPGPGQGSIAVRLVDAPLPLDSVKEVNVFIVRVDARRARVDTTEHDSSETALNSGLMALHRDGLGRDEDDDEGEHRDSTRWVTIAEPNKAFNLLELQNGVSAFLGETAVDTGHFKAVRLVIDPMQSSIVLKDGTVLSPTSSPPVEFDSRGRHALFVEFGEEVEVEEHATTTVVLDIKLATSLTLRGRTLRDGFIFRPVVVGRCERTH